MSTTLFYATEALRYKIIEAMCDKTFLFSCMFDHWIEFSDYYWNFIRFRILQFYCDFFDYVLGFPHIASDIQCFNQKQKAPDYCDIFFVIIIYGTYSTQILIFVRSFLPPILITCTLPTTFCELVTKIWTRKKYTIRLRLTFDGSVSQSQSFQNIWVIASEDIQVSEGRLSGNRIIEKKLSKDNKVILICYSLMRMNWKVHTWINFNSKGESNSGPY